MGYEYIMEELTQLADDDAIKAVILTGAGERAFSAGADMHELAGFLSRKGQRA